MKLRMGAGLAVVLALVACNQQPPNPIPPNTQVVKWSEKPEWNVAGAQVTIPQGTTALLDKSTPGLRSLTIEGNLVFDRTAKEPLVLQSDWIMVHGGRLEVGTATQPFEGQAEIVLTSNNLQDNVEHMGMKMGAKGLGVMMGGVVEMHGKARAASWTRLSATAAKGATSITLQKAVDWPVGSEIVIASTDHYGWAAGVNPANPRSEKAIVKAVRGNTVDLEKPLAWGHWGADASGVPQYAEVGLLSRNIVVRSDTKALESASAAFQKGGHVMVMGGGNSQARFSWVEFRHMGQKAVFGRYPIHYHQLGDLGEGSYIKNVSIRESFNRAVVVHGTNKLLLEGNVAHDILGHAYFLEEGSETKNVFRSNLVVLVRSLRTNPEERLISTDNRPSGFWITNPDNTFVDNAAVEASIGFWYALPARPIPFGRNNQDLAWMDNIYPRRTAMGEFRGNVAHSNQDDGLFVDLGLKSNLCANDASRNTCKDHTAPSQVDDETTGFDPRRDPTKGINNDPANANYNPRVWAEFKDLVAYKNGNRGVWLRGTYHKLVNPRMADNAIGATFASNLSYLEGGLIVGESDNNTTKITGQWTTGLVGFEHYDGHVGASGTVFRNFSGTQQRGVYCGSAETTITTRNAAIGTLRWTSFGLTGQNFINNVTFDNANRVNYDDPQDPCFNTARNDEDSRDGYRTGVFYDQNGSVTGAAGSSVVVKNDFLSNANCSLRSEWNAYVCNANNLYATLSISNEESSRRALAGTDLSSPLTIARNDGPQTRLWGMPRDGLSGVNTYFEARLIAKRGDSSANDYRYNVNFGTANRSARLRVGLNYRKLADGSLPAGVAGSRVIVSVPVPSGQVWVYRNYYFNEQYNKSTQVASLNDLIADTTGKAFYREGDTLYLKLSVSQQDLDRSGDYGAGVNYHICNTLECK